MRVLLVAATAAALAPPALKTARRTVATNAAVDFVPEKARPLSVAIAGGGVLPNIHANLLPKKSQSKK